MFNATSRSIPLLLLFAVLAQVVQARTEDSSRLSGSLDQSAAHSPIDPALQKALSAGDSEEFSVIVTLKDQADLKKIKEPKRAARLKKVVEVLKQKAARGQKNLLAFLTARQKQGKVSDYTPYWIFNGLAVTASQEVIAELAARPDVLSITPDETISLAQESLAGSNPEANLVVVNAPAIWDSGFRGQGVVVANVDTGVYLNHPDLVDRWRGGSNSWFDPSGQHPTTPTDVSGHGTWTMGVMVGDSAGGTAIGVAPEATWIAVKIFDDQGKATTSGIHQGYQWLLDPDGNPETPDAPHVVNSSWGYSSPGCRLEFQLDLQALRAAGILPVFSAGNTGPNGSTSVSPANNPEAFAVGAVNNSDGIYTYSARGPSACGESETIFPEMVAPGVSIRTSDLFGLYTWATGTSLAAPHIAGALALLLDAFPDLTADQQATALLNTAVDLGSPGPDNTYGAGRLDIWAAYQWLLASFPTPSPTATETALPSTDTPTPTETLTPDPTETSTLTPSATPTAEASATPTATSSPTPTATETPAPTATQTGTPGGNSILYLSLKNRGPYPVGAIPAVSGEDVIAFDGSGFTMYFDGSDVSLSGVNLDAFHRIDTASILLSIDKSASIPGLGSVDDSDILRFDGTAFGESTTGTFSVFLRGADVGLTTNNEDLDAIDLLADGSLVVSTVGGVSVPGLGGTYQDEDLLLFTPAVPGNYTSGAWAIYFDGSDVDLATNNGEDLTALSVAANGDLYLATLDSFSVAGVSGANEDIFVCESPVNGPDTSCLYAPVLYFDGSLWGLESNSLDAIQVREDDGT